MPLERDRCVTATCASASSCPDGLPEVECCWQRDPKQPYFSAKVQVADTGGLGPIEHDLELVQGIQVRGRVTDKETGKPVSAAAVHYSPLYPNEHAATLGDRIGRPCSQASIQPDGSYAITVLPGPGVVAVQAFAYYERYMPALVTRDDLAKHFKDTKLPDVHSEFLLSVYSGPALMGMLQKNYNVMKLIDPAEDAEALSLDLVLDPGLTLAGKLLDGDGKPVSGASVIGLTSHTFHVDELDTDSFEARAINPGRGRHVFFYHQEKNLGAVLDVKGDERKSLTVKMQPCGAVAGRLLGADDEPRDGVTIECNCERTSGGPGNVWAKTDAKGRFRVEGLVPGQKYSVRIANSRAFTLGEVVVQSGGTKKLGDVNERLP